ncbi:potassium channel family protein [Dietzia natronolimnaea]|uniref:potassium channel family protein n=1 Tax=Dietzia natronolimnaea TaxID=161920 RepID=UPI003D0E3834
MADRNRRQSPVLIVGLGRFGVSLATQLVSQGREVLAVERDHGLVQKYADSLTHVVEADASDIEALQQLGAQDFSTAVVGVGTSIESSVLVAVNLVDLGVEHVWAKAINKAHGKILTRIGCHHVVFPEHDAGVRVAHLVANQMMNFIKFDDNFAIARMLPPERRRRSHHRPVPAPQPPQGQHRGDQASRPALPLRGAGDLDRCGGRDHRLRPRPGPREVRRPLRPEAIAPADSLAARRMLVLVRLRD